MKTEEKVVSLTLDSRHCCQVALYMYEEYKKAMRPPVVCFIDFEDWLKMVLKNLGDNETICINARSPRLDGNKKPSSEL